MPENNAIITLINASIEYDEFWISFNKLLKLNFLSISLLKSRSAQSVGLSAAVFRSTLARTGPEGAAFRTQAYARTRTRDRFLPVDAVLRRRA